MRILLLVALALTFGCLGGGGLPTTSEVVKGVDDRLGVCVHEAGVSLGGTKLDSDGDSLGRRSKYDRRFQGETSGFVGFATVNVDLTRERCSRIPPR